MKLNESPEIMTIEDIREALNISYSKARHLVIAHIRHIKIGRTYRVTRKAFMEFLGETNNTKAESIHYELDPY